MDNLKCISPNELAALAAVVGVAIAQKLDIDEQNVVGAFANVVGDVISLIAAQGEFLRSEEEDGSENGDGKGNEDLQKQIDELRDYIRALECKINGQ